jgi:hypothetical protein
MGTSTSNRGQNGNTPLVPSWLGENDGDQQPGQPLPGQPQPAQPQPEQPQLADPKRFSAPRGNFTRYVNSGGSGGGNLHRATSDYVRHSLGGSQNATTRLGSARNSTARLVSIFSSFANRGVAETSRDYKLGDIIGKSASDVLLRIMDFVCPDGGRTDEGIARNSYIEALSTLPDWEDKTIESLTPAEFLAFTEIYMANVIEERLVNDIGNKLFALPNDVAQVENLQGQLKDYIKGAISDSVSKLNIDIHSIDTSQTKAIVDSIYRRAYDILSGLEE